MTDTSVRPDEAPTPPEPNGGQPNATRRQPPGDGGDSDEGDGEDWQVEE